MAVTWHCLQAGVADNPADTQSLLQQPVKGNTQLITGQLANGLRYVLLPNRTPPQRFEAHLEVHAGSVDELAHEQVRKAQAAALQLQIHGRFQHWYQAVAMQW